MKRQVGSVLVWVVGAGGVLVMTCVAWRLCGLLLDFPAHGEDAGSLAMILGGVSFPLFTFMAQDAWDRDTSPSWTTLSPGDLEAFTCELCPACANVLTDWLLEHGAKKAVKTVRYIDDPNRGWR